MKSFIRSLLFLGGLVLFLEAWVLVANHKGELSSTSKQKKVSSSATMTGGRNSGTYNTSHTAIINS